MRTTAKACATGFLTALIAWVLSGCGKMPSAAEYMEQARAFHAKRDHKAAIILLKNVLSTAPDDSNAHLLLGTLYNETGEYVFAEMELRRAQLADADPFAVTAGLAHSLLGRGEYKKLLDEFELFEKEHPELTPELLTLQGDARAGAGRQDARSSYSAALKKNTGFVPAQLGLARIVWREGRIEAALHAAASMLEQAPQNTDVWLFKGDLERSRLALEDAEKSYRRALDIMPNDVQSRLRLVDLYVGTNKLDAARTEIAAVRKSEPQNLMAVYQQASIYVTEKRYTEARDAIQQVRKLAPDHLPSLRLAGAVAYFTGSSAQAERELSTYLSHFPNDVPTRKLLAANSLRTGQPEKALEFMNPLLPVGNDAQVFAIAGEAALRTNQFARAAEYLKKSATLAPQDARVRTQLGISRLATGEAASGIADLASASTLSSDSTQADLILALAHLERKEYDKALAVIAVLEKKQPVNPVVFNLRAQALLAQGNTVQARKNLETALELQPDYFLAANNLAALDVRDKSLEAARKRLGAFLERNPSSVSAMLSLADIADRSLDDKDRLRWLEKAAATSPATLQPHLLLTRHHLEQNDFRKAVATARRAQLANPQSAEALALLAKTQLAVGEKADAVTTYYSLVKLTPNSAAAHYGLASALAESKNISAAQASLTKALELQPGYLDAEVAMATLEANAGRFPEALRLAQRIRSRSPKSPVGAALEGDVRMSQGDFAGAARAYDAALEISTSSVLFINAHGALVRAGKTKEADAKAVDWLKRNPADNASRMYLADTATAAAKNQVAIGYYQAVIERDRANAVAFNNLAWLYQQENDPRALPAAEQALKLRPGDAKVLDTLGWILVQQSDTARGINLMQRALAVTPKSTALRYHLAVGYAKSGDKVKARATLDALLAAEDAFPQRKDALALHGQL